MIGIPNVSRSGTSSEVGNYAVTLGSNDAIPLAISRDLTYKTCDSSSLKRSSAGSASVGNYMMIGGGFNSDGVANTDAYSDTLTHTIPASLSNPRYNVSAASDKSHRRIFFSAGFLNSGSSNFESIDWYTSSLTHCSDLTSTYGCYLGGYGSADNHVVFGNHGVENVEAFSINGSHTGITPFTNRNSGGIGGRIGNHVLMYAGNFTEVKSYNASTLTQSIAPDTDQKHTNGSSCNVGDYLVFVGDPVLSGGSKRIDVYDENLTKHDGMPLDVILGSPTYLSTAVSCGEYGLLPYYKQLVVLQENKNKLA